MLKKFGNFIFFVNLQAVLCVVREGAYACVRWLAQACSRNAHYMRVETNRKTYCSGVDAADAGGRRDAG